MSQQNVGDRVQADLRPHPREAWFPTVILILAIAFAWTILWLVHSWGYIEDDGFIHLEFARSLFAGRGFSFNGSVVYGDTAPLWVMLLAFVHLLVSDWKTTSKVLCSLGAIFALTAVFAFSRRLTAGSSNSRTFAAGMVLLLVVNPYFCYWSFSGMETLSAAGLALWTVLAATSNPLTNRKFLLGCALAGIAPVLRPEMIFFTAIVALLLLYREWTVQKAEPAQKTLTVLLPGLILLAAPTLAWATYAVHTFGRVIPNTNAAKRAVATDSIALRLINVYSLGFPIIVLGLLAAFLYLLMNATRLKECYAAVRQNPAQFAVIAAGGWIFLLWTFISATFYIVDHTFVQTRYILVSAIGLSIVVMAMIRAIFRRVYQLSFVAALVTATVISAVSVRPFLHNKSAFVQAVQQEADFIRNRIPADEPVATYFIGELAFFSEHPLVDTGGITRPGAIPYLNTPPADMVRWIHSEGAFYYATGEQPEPGAVRVFSMRYPYVGWALNPRHYAETFDINLWKLNDSTRKPLQPQSPPSQSPQP